VPDNITGHEAIITLVCLLQIALITTPLGAVVFRRYRLQRDQRGAVQEQKKSQSDTFWESQMQKKKKSAEKANVERSTK
jgi:hypothetical protein